MKPSAAEDPQEKTAMPVERERWARLKQVFEGALERDPASRGAYLDAACGEDRALRGEAESLLAARDRADSFFGKAPASPTEPGSAAASESEGRLAARALR